MSRYEFNTASLSGLNAQDKEFAERAVKAGEKIANMFQRMLLNQENPESPQLDFSDEERDLLQKAMDFASFEGVEQATTLEMATFKVFLAEMLEFYEARPQLFIEHLEIEDKPYEAQGYLVELRILKNQLPETYKPIDDHFTKAFNAFSDWVKDKFAYRGSRRPSSGDKPSP